MSETASGIDALTGRPITVVFRGGTASVEPCAAQPNNIGVFLAPGFLDLQVNGFGGVDYGSELTDEDLGRSLEAQIATGVTRILATVITGSEEAMLASVRRLAQARRRLAPMGEHVVAGLHIEGPHISPQDGPRGAHPKAHARPPSLAEFEHWQEASSGLVKMVTLAPEWPEALGYIEALVKRGIVVAIGHTAATAEQIADAVSAGATVATHLGNATFPAPPKFNPLWDMLADDRLAASLIADGFHLPASFLKTALRAKGAGRLVLVTDAAAPAGAAPGRYKLGEVEVELSAGGRVTLAGGTRLAGSALRLDGAVLNIMRMAGATLAEAIAMVTVNPAGIMGLPLPGGDWVEFSLAGDAMQIRRVWVAGTLAYTALY